MLDTGQLLLLLNNHVDFNEHRGYEKSYFPLNVFGRLLTSIKFETLPKEKRHCLKRFYVSYPYSKYSSIISGKT